MIFHIDGNSFYASCERLFRPDLRGKPIVVLSNNDGIIVALSQEAKEAGFKRGDVFFKVRERLNSAGVAVFSSNYTLYADMSRRVNLIYSRFTPDVEFYSIDESFLFFGGNKENWQSLGREIRETVRLETGLPVSVGIAPTKTLAKICNKLAKKHGGVCEWAALDGEAVLAAYPAGDVWGVGRSKAAFLKKRGVMTALDLKNYPLDKANKNLTVTGLRTVRELNGVPSLGRVEPEARQQIIVSKSFSEAVFTEDLLQRALAEHTQEAVKRLRSEALVCGIVSVYLMTNAYASGEQYSNAALEKLPAPSAFLPEIGAVAGRLLHGIYRPGYKYRKVMILLAELGKEAGQQTGLFDDASKIAKEKALMKSFDAINGRYGRKALRLASQGAVRGGLDNDDFLPFEMRRSYLSPCYTTRLADCPRVK
jgi:DNA polymerase V